MENIINAAQIENGLVTNVIVVTDINFMPNLVEIPDGMSVGIGWSYIENQFVSPPEVIENISAPTAEELMTQLQAIQAQIAALGA